MAAATFDEQQQQGGARRKPGWMSIPGGPKEPSRDSLNKAIGELAEQKNQCFERIKALRAEMDATRGDTGDSEERRAAQESIAATRKQRTDHREAGLDKNKKMKAAIDRKRQLEDEFRTLDGVSAFKSLEEIDAAIDRVHYKMETGRGTLAEEKKCTERLKMLERAKDLLLKIAPLQEAIAVEDERVANLRDDATRDFEEAKRLGAEYEAKMQVRNESQKDYVELREKRNALFEQVRDQGKLIDEIKSKMDALRDAFTADMAKWNEWRETAKAKWKLEQDKIWEEKQKARRDKDEARRLERKRERLAKKLNPHAAKIIAAAALIRFLEEKAKQQVVDREAAERRRKLAAFDPAKAAPAGLTVLVNAEEEDFSFGGKKGKKGGKKSGGTKGGAAASPAVATTAGGDDDRRMKERTLNLSSERHGNFASCGVEAPLTYGKIPAAVEALKKKKAEFEAAIKTIEEVSDSDNEEEEEVHDDAAAAVGDVAASTVVPADLAAAAEVVEEASEPTDPAPEAEDAVVEEPAADSAPKQAAVEEKPDGNPMVPDEEPVAAVEESAVAAKEPEAVAEEGEKQE